MWKPKLSVVLHSFTDYWALGFEVVFSYYMDQRTRWSKEQHPVKKYVWLISAPSAMGSWQTWRLSFTLYSLLGPGGLDVSGYLDGDIYNSGYHKPSICHSYLKFPVILLSFIVYESFLKKCSKRFIYFFFLMTGFEHSNFFAWYANEFCLYQLRLEIA